MEMKGVFIVIVVLAVAVFGVILGYYTDRKSTFDERQLLARAGAYRVGFGSLIIADLAIMLLQSWSKWTEVVDSTFAMMAALMVSLMVFSIYCVTHDAFFQRKENPEAYLGICIVVLFGNVMAVISHYSDHGTLLVNGKLTLSPGGNLAFGVMFFVLIVTISIKMLVTRPEEDEE